MTQRVFGGMVCFMEFFAMRLRSCVFYGRKTGLCSGWARALFKTAFIKSWAFSALQSQLLCKICSKLYTEIP